MTTSQIAVASTVAPSASTKAARKPRAAKAADPKTSKPRAEKKVAAPKAPRAPRKVKAVASPVVEQVVVTEALTFEPEPTPVVETVEKTYFFDEADKPNQAVEVKAPRAKKEKAPSKAYPFITRNQVLSLLSTDDDAVLQSLQSLDARQTETEQERAQTISRNRSGWTSSHAPKGTALAKKAREVGLTAEEVSEARSLVSHYSKQLCRQMRDEEIAKNPALAETAALFSC